MNRIIICKKTFLAIFMLAMFASNASAQKTCFGFSAGANFSNLIGRDKIDDSEPRIGLYGGVNIDIPLAYGVYLEVGGFYSSQGVKVKIDEYQALKGGVNQQVHYTRTANKFVNYLHVPLSWKQSFGDVYTKLGPYVAMPLTVNSDWEEKKVYVAYSDSTNAEKTDGETIEKVKGNDGKFVNNLRQYDVGAALGIGFQTSISRGLDWFIDASYKIGFFSIERTTDTSKKQIRNQCFTISTGIYFIQKRSSRIYRR